MRRDVNLLTMFTLIAALLVGCAADRASEPPETAPPEPTETAKTARPGATETAHPEPELTATLVVEEGPDGTLEIDDSHHDALRVYRGQQIRWRVRCDGCDEQNRLEFTVAGLHLVSELQGPRDHAKIPEQSPAPCEELSRQPANPVPEHPLFGDWTPPGLWTAQDEAIESAPVRRGPIAHGIWKYTWKVRRVGEPETAVCWDPHIFGHPGIAF